MWVSLTPVLPASSAWVARTVYVPGPRCEESTDQAAPDRGAVIVATTVSPERTWTPTVAASPAASPAAPAKVGVSSNEAAPFAGVVSVTAGAISSCAPRTHSPAGRFWRSRSSRKTAESHDVVALVEDREEERVRARA